MVCWLGEACWKGGEREGKEGDIKQGLAMCFVSQVLTYLVFMKSTCGMFDVSHLQKQKLSEKL